MEKIETIFSNFECDNIISMPTTQVALQNSVETSTYGGISKLLCLKATAEVVSMEMLEKQAKINGKICFKVMFLTLKGEMKNMEFRVEFATILENPIITPKSLLFAKCSVLDIDKDILDNLLKLQCVVDIESVAVLQNSQKALMSITNVCNKKVCGKFANCTEKVCESCALTADEATGCNIDDIVHYDCNVVLNKIVCVEGKVCATGEVSCSVVYTSEQMMATKCFNIPFTQEIEAKSSKSSSMAFLQTKVKECKLLITGEERDNLIRINCDIMCEGVVFDMQENYYVEDVYSPNCNLTTENQNVESNILADMVFETDRVSGSFLLEDESVGSIRRIVCCNAISSNVNNVIVQQDCFVLEGLLMACVVYETDEQAISSIMVELPFSLQYEKQGLCPNYNLFVKSICNNICAKVKMQKDIEVSAQLSFCGYITKQQQYNFIKMVDIGEEKQVEDCAISIYFSKKNDTMWDIVKGVNANEDVILKQNPSLIERTQGKKVIVYHEINM
ncbi:MAG: DUF3794 domain-containing protein [Clostridia bacterium]